MRTMKGNKKINVNFAAQGIRGSSCHRKGKKRERGRSEQEKTSKSWFVASHGLRTLGR